MKYLLLIGLFIYSSLSYCQVYKFKAFQSKAEDYSIKNKHKEWEDVDILIVLNLDKKKLYTYGESNAIMDLVNLKTYYDDNGDYWREYDGIDQIGRQSKIQFLIYKDQSGDHCATLFINYEEYTFLIIFRLKKDD